MKSAVGAKKMINIGSIVIVKEGYYKGKIGKVLGFWMSGGKQAVYLITKSGAEMSVWDYHISEIEEKVGDLYRCCCGALSKNKKCCICKNK